MKKFLLALILAVLLTVVIGTPALAWYGPQCDVPDVARDNAWDSQMWMGTNALWISGHGTGPIVPWFWVFKF